MIGIIILIMVIISGVGWCGYYLEVQEKQRIVNALPENIKNLYLRKAA